MTINTIMDQIDTPEFAQAIANEQDNAKLAALFQAKGIQVTPQDIAAAKAASQNGELGENDLELVAGGGFKWRYLNPVYWVGRLIAAAVTSDMC